MAIRERINKSWTRKHDNPEAPLIPSAPKILYPETLEDLIAICSERESANNLKAGGSHWSLSESAISDEVFIEMNDPANEFSPMGRTLYGVIPGCLTTSFKRHLSEVDVPKFDSHTISNIADIGTFNANTGYLVHVEAGKRIYQLYAELDKGDDYNSKSLAVEIKEKYGKEKYFGSWAFHTLGGAGGQTVFGALTTGTHGSDVKLPPIADAVLAMHIVVDGGKHYWLERKVDQEVLVTDDQRLIALYGNDRYRGNSERGIDNFEIIRDDDIFNSVLMSAGRFGVVYSIVLKAVRQYCLNEVRSLDDWQNVKQYLQNNGHALYSNKFLQVGISVTPYENFTKNRCGVTVRNNAIAVPNEESPNGRKERRGDMSETFDTSINAYVFANAGKTHFYSPDPDNPNSVLPASFLDRACTNSDFIDGVLENVISDIEEFVNSNGAAIIGVVFAVAGPAGVGLLLLVPALIAILEILRFLRNLFRRRDTRFGEVLNTVRDALLSNPDPLARAAGIFTWQCISLEVFESQQKPISYTAISYAVMDKFDYLDRSCQVNVDSIEVFFDGFSEKYITFVDQLLEFEKQQEYMGKAFVGYISLRFTSETKALIGMEKFSRTCAVEVAGLKDVEGTVELIDRAMFLARNLGTYAGILHWGQRNEHSMEEIQYHFGDRVGSPTGNLSKWRKSLSRLTDNGRLGRFSNVFTRRTGLEIVTPTITSLVSDRETVTLGESITIRWDATHNPTYTEIRIEIKEPDGNIIRHDRQAFMGELIFPGRISGTYSIKIFAFCTLNLESRRRSLLIRIQVI